MPVATVVFTALLLLQSALVVTGGAVRLTGSGLGCPTWPECTKGSIKPLAHPAQGQLHAWIEFGNRLIAWLIFLFAVLALIYVVKKLKDRPDYKRLKNLAFLQLLGFLAQVILGGITVLTKLNPISVSAHFILSLPLIAGALTLRSKILDKPSVFVGETTRLLIRILVGVGIAVLALGTVVTGTGPHAGDIAAKRYRFDPRIVSWIHADLVILLISMIIAFILVIRASESGAPKKLIQSKAKQLLGIALAQGAIGYLQYFTKLPELLVGAHILGATLVWLAIWDLNISGRTSSNAI
jgi:cytochrome c oxidase assembly protein subunit 15